jgi:F0F1-type ATP synthase membrane subunit b/b'
MARERVRVSLELKDQAVELVMAASERILKRSLTDADQKRLVKEAIDQLN